MSVPNLQPFKFALWHKEKCPRTRPYLPRRSRGLSRESEAARLLAARIPPELFEVILFYVNVNRASQRRDTRTKNLKRNQGVLGAKDILTDLKQCSLVCLFWANRCREHIFQDKTLEITSYDDAEIFRRYIVGGCPRLMPVHQLISEITIGQYYESRRSFLHLLYLPAIQDKFTQLNIVGPVPKGFNSAKLDTPHWGVPPSIVVPSSFLQNSIEIGNVHFPSFSHVIKYIRHFLCAAYIVFATITWDAHGVPLIIPRASSTIICQRRPQSLRIEVLGVCTDSVHLALTALMMNPNCPLHRLSDEERVWMIKSMTLLWGHSKDSDVHIRLGFDVSEQTTTMDLDPLEFHFLFEEAIAFTDRSASALSVVGMHAYIDDFNLRTIPASFDALVDHLRTQPTIRALVLLFESLDFLQQLLNPFVEVLTLATGTIEIVLAYENSEERKAVGVDLATLEPNGCVYTWIDEQSHNYWNIDMRLQMLQRQLKKKRWISVH